ncbi:MAG TPA: MarR family winged helix-turn-helix transcriptional regulator [Rhizomicrobium sp.]|nr:MarR family winged helix-turn-helix transcriptional regulator [Rhizomicrobium sp.]
MSSTKPHPGLGTLLRLAAQTATDEFARWIADSGFEGIKPAHSAAIQPLWDVPGGARLTTLARASRITKQSMSALVDDLERWGYVERVEDPDDARAIRVRLTAQGRTYGQAARAFARSIEADWGKRIGACRMAELRTALEMLRAEVFLAGE